MRYGAGALRRHSFADGHDIQSHKLALAELATTNALAARRGHTTVLSGREPLVWGGVNGAGTALTNGARVELDAGQGNTFTNTYPIANGHSAV